jgi:hypothetical protein
MVVANARAVAYNDVFRLCAIVFVVSLPTILLLGKAQAAKGTPPVPAAE